MKPTISTDKYELYLGDCLDVLPHLEPVDLLLTDPPYGNNYHTGHRKGILRYSTKTTGDIIEKPILNDTLDDLVPLLKDVVEIAGGLMSDNAAVYWFCAPDRLDTILPIIRKQWEVVNIICWDKGNCSAGDLKQSYGKQWEACIYAVTKKMPLLGSRDRDVIRESRGDTASYVHPTQKPVPLIEKLLLKHDAKRTLDPFMGSGTTGVACIKNNRYFIGIEREEKYFDIAVKRLEQCAAQGMLELVA